MKFRADEGVHPELKREIKWGSITLSHKDNVAYSKMVDRIAHDGSELCLLSCVAPAGQIKAFRAILHTNTGKPYINVGDLETRRPSQGDHRHRSVGNLNVSEKGYSLKLHKLEFGLVHAVFITRSHEFITYLDPENLWLKLKTDKYTTPLLKAWMPYVTKKLIEDSRLRECKCFRCNCGVISINDDSVLDEIVSDGIKGGEIQIS